MSQVYATGKGRISIPKIWIKNGKKISKHASLPSFLGSVVISALISCLVLLCLFGFLPEPAAFSQHGCEAQNADREEIATYITCMCLQNGPTWLLLQVQRPEEMWWGEEILDAARHISVKRQIMSLYDQLFWHAEERFWVLWFRGRIFCPQSKEILVKTKELLGISWHGSSQILRFKGLCPINQISAAFVSAKETHKSSCVLM